jgi:phage terminase large subunit-like protein
MAVTSASSPSFASRLADRVDPPPWEPKGRPKLEPHQIAPPDRWKLWLLEGGRGCGKTEACSRYFASWMRAHPGHRGRIIAPTFGDAVEACITGPSGLQSVDPEIEWLPSAPGGAKVRWPNGSEALVFGTHAPSDVDRLRAGGNRHLDWWEEMAANRHLKEAWPQAQFGLRLGDWPHSIASTTPKATTAYKEVRGEAGVVRTHGTIDQNPHLSAEWKQAQKDRWAGTRLGRQELDGELLEDVAGALWTRGLIDEGRVTEAPQLRLVVVALDPAVSSGPSSDDTGIVIAGLGIDGHGYVLDDRTCHLPPEGWASRAVAAYDHHEADRIVGEVNNGGDMVRLTIGTVNANVPFKAVHASRGKQTRAQPIAALYGSLEEGQERAPRIHHVGSLPELEDEMCGWVPEDAKSPDRMDALVWAMTDLMIGAVAPSAPSFSTKASRWKLD